MRYLKTLLLIPAGLLCLSAAVHAAPTITVGNYVLVPNTPGQTIYFDVNGIVPNAGTTAAPGNVNGMTFTVAIAEGGPAYGGPLGPKTTSIDVDSGPSIWVAPNSPSGHIAPTVFIDPGGQLAQITLLTTSGFVNVSSGILAMLVIDMTGLPPGGGFGDWSITLAGGIVEEHLGNTELIGSSTPDPVIINYENGNSGSILIVPEPSGVALAAIGLIGVAAWGFRRRR
jgi:hypothetical protein